MDGYDAGDLGNGAVARQEPLKEGFFEKIAGVSSNDTVRPGPHDRMQASALGMQAVASGLFNSVLVCVALVSFGTSLLGRCVAVTLAILYTATLWTGDRRTIISSWSEAGEHDISDAKLGSPRRLNLDRRFATFFRVGQAAVNGAVVATLLVVNFVFRPDIIAEETRWERIANGPLIEEVRNTDYRGNLAALEATKKEAGDELRALEVRWAAVSPGAPDGLLAQDLISLKALDARRNIAEIAQQSAAPSTGSGKVAVRRADAAARRTASMAREAAALRSEIARLQTELGSRADRDEAADLAPRVEAARKRYDESARAANDFRQAGPSWVAEHAKSDVRWLNGHGTVLADLVSLGRILAASPPLVAAFVLALKLALIAAESGVALGKALNPPRGPYATARAAEAAELRARAAAQAEYGEIEAAFRKGVRKGMRNRERRPESRAEQGEGE